MATNEPAAKGTATDRPASWRDFAVARSLDPARLRAEKRVQRFLDAALELMNSDSAKEFTVQEVVDRSGQSLRSFYQYFAGKHELLLALFEESVRTTAERLQELIAEEDDPIERLRRFTLEYYLVCRPTPKGKAGKNRPTPALGEFAQQLLTDHPKEASLAYVPLVSLLEQVLDDAAAAGAIRPDLDHRRIAGVVLQAISFNAFSTTISGSSLRTDGRDAAEELWTLLLHGIGTGTPA
jgi:AcrR family transcriptional regulator